jgi:hypothetical protein
MPSIVDYIRTIPGARITSTKRDPRSRLGRANPRSYHNIGQAVDIAPIAGMSFDQYVNRLKGAGYNIVEAIDEARNPLPHTTGPNWHIAYGQSPVAKPSQPMVSSNIHGILDGLPSDDGGDQMPPTFGSGAQMPGGPMSMDDPRPSGLAGILSDIPDTDPVQKPKRNTGAVIAGIIADAIAGGFGRQGGFAPAYLNQQEENRNLELYREKVAAERAERLAPKLEQIGDTIGMVDPRTGQFNPTYQAPAKAPQPTNAARMLIEQGIMPGTPEFNARMRRYMERPLVIDGQPFGYADGGGETGGGRTVVRTGVDQTSGRRVVQYDDGTVDYAD